MVVVKLDPLLVLGNVYGAGKSYQLINRITQVIQNQLVTEYEEIWEYELGMNRMS